MVVLSENNLADRIHLWFRVKSNHHFLLTNVIAIQSMQRYSFNWNRQKNTHTHTPRCSYHHIHSDRPLAFALDSHFRLIGTAIHYLALGEPHHRTSGPVCSVLHKRDTTARCGKLQKKTHIHTPQRAEKGKRKTFTLIENDHACTIIGRGGQEVLWSRGRGWGRSHHPFRQVPF